MWLVKNSAPEKYRRQKTEAAGSAQLGLGAEVPATTAASDKLNVCVEK